jgi:hypothetical protein
VRVADERIADFTVEVNVAADDGETRFRRLGIEGVVKAFS